MFPNTRTPLKSEITAAPKWQVPTRPHPTAGCPQYYLEGEVKERFIALYPRHTIRRIMQWFGISSSTAHRLARSLNLARDQKAIAREHGRDVKRINERNGFYDSLRGKRPSEAAIEGTKRLRAAGFNPRLQMKQKNPRKYKKMVQTAAARRMEAFNRDKRRVALGLEQLTNLNVGALGRRASHQKSAMKRAHNYFTDPDHPTWICYDSKTTRSPRMEDTARRCGLLVVKGEDE